LFVIQIAFGAGVGSVTVPGLGFSSSRVAKRVAGPTDRPTNGIQGFDRSFGPRRVIFK